MINEYFYKSFLEKMRNGEVSIDEVVNVIGVCRRSLVEMLRRIDGIYIGGDKIILKDKLMFALSLMKKGVSLEYILLSLEWRDMEEIVGEILEKHGYDVVRNFRFKFNCKRFEIDILAEKFDEKLIIECKRWRHLSLSMITKIVENHISKSQHYVRYVGNIRLDGKDIKKYIPIIVTSFEPPVKMYKGVPIVPLHSFNNFLLEYRSYIDSIKVLP